MSIENEKEGEPFDNMRKTVELLKPEEKPKSNVHPLFGRILRAWSQEIIELGDVR